MEDPVAFVSCGPSENGIVRFGRDLVHAARSVGFGGVARHEPDPLRLDELVGHLPPGITWVHLQINDWLLRDGRTAPEERLASFAAAVRAAGAGLSLTLHDLPHPAVGPELFRRRALTYARMCAEAVAVVVSSEHERRLLADALAVAAEVGVVTPGRPTTVIRLPVPSPVAGHDAPSAPECSAGSVGILGFVYPGKGHDDVLAELGDRAGPAPPLTVVAIGRPSPGHEDMPAELAARAARLGLGFRCTGYVPDEQLAGYLRAVAVPVAPAARMSASASINSWIAAGRRPLVRDNRYSREFEAANPGAIRRYARGGLGTAVEQARARPASTWLPETFRGEPDAAAAAAQYLRFVRDLGWHRMR
ncbi:hypothetical protein SAMN04515671_4000 [Nakamurella panacisegetis]|uniref:Uncharacterized protein n=1 Tax=Nakamurella panacisegetis TaxID=1090615 RepID=A0A1H0SAQ5_9ACTN|nr:hypothetical protein [Nakamurella panacisegetis]SDP38881.1 hypothetical protein SAMN04515671_4000 [Nakamurella panacisegetis]